MGGEEGRRGGGKSRQHSGLINKRIVRPLTNQSYLPINNLTSAK